VDKGGGSRQEFGIWGERWMSGSMLCFRVDLSDQSCKWLKTYAFVCVRHARPPFVDRYRRHKST